MVVHSSELQFRPRRQLVVRAGDDSGEITLRFFSFYPSQQAALSASATAAGPARASDAAGSTRPAAS